MELALLKDHQQSSEIEKPSVGFYFGSTNSTIICNVEGENKSVIIKMHNKSPKNMNQNEKEAWINELKDEAFAILNEQIKSAYMAIPWSYEEDQIMQIKEAGISCELKLIICAEQEIKEEQILHIGTKSSYYISNGILKEIDISGSTFDFKIANYLLNDFKVHFGVDLEKNIMAKKKFLNFAEKAKRTLEFKEETLIEISLKNEGEHYLYQKKLNREKMNELCADEFKSLSQLFNGATACYLVGNSFRIPGLAEVISNDHHDNLRKTQKSLIEDRLFEIEEPKPSTLEQIISFFQMDEGYEQTLGGNSSTYFILAILLMFLVPLSIYCVYFLLREMFYWRRQAGCRGCKSVFFYLRMIVILLICLLFALPGMAVVYLQYNCIIYLLPDNDAEIIFSEDLFSMQIGIVIIFSCMIFTEMSQGVNSFYYVCFLSRKIRKANGCFETFIHSLMFLFGILSPIFQILISFFLLQITLFVIINSEDTISLIQNFAGLFVVIQFDDVIMQFLDIFPFRNFIDNMFQKKNYFRETKNEFFAFSVYKLCGIKPEILKLTIRSSDEFSFNFNEIFCTCPEKKKEGEVWNCENCTPGKVGSMLVIITKIILTFAMVALNFYFFSKR